MSNTGACVVPLFGTAAGFIALLVVMASTAVHVT